MLTRFHSRALTEISFWPIVNSAQRDRDTSKPRTAPCLFQCTRPNLPLALSVFRIRAPSAMALTRSVTSGDVTFPARMHLKEVELVLHQMEIVTRYTTHNSTTFFCF